MSNSNNKQWFNSCSLGQWWLSKIGWQRFIVLFCTTETMWPSRQWSGGGEHLRVSRQEVNAAAGCDACTSLPLTHRWPELATWLHVTVWGWGGVSTKEKRAVMGECKKFIPQAESHSHDQNFIFQTLPVLKQLDHLRSPDPRTTPISCWLSFPKSCVLCPVTPRLSLLHSLFSMVRNSSCSDFIPEYTFGQIWVKFDSSKMALLGITRRQECGG